MLGVRIPDGPVTGHSSSNKECDDICEGANADWANRVSVGLFQSVADAPQSPRRPFPSWQNDENVVKANSKQKVEPAKVDGLPRSSHISNQAPTWHYSQRGAQNTEHFQNYKVRSLFQFLQSFGTVCFLDRWPQTRIRNKCKVTLQTVSVSSSKGHREDPLRTVAYRWK